MRKILLCLVSVLICVTFPQAQSNGVQTNGKVCGNPSAPCLPSERKFQANDISFKLPRTLKWQTYYYSANFYAVILKSKRAVADPDGQEGATECSGYYSESERIKVQKQFPSNKVFTSRSGCVGSGIDYTNYNYDYNFLAVYAGATKNEAKQILKTVKAKGYSDANIRKTQVVFDYGD